MCISLEKYMLMCIKKTNYTKLKIHLQLFQEGWELNQIETSVTYHIIQFLSTFHFNVILEFYGLKSVN